MKRLWVRAVLGLCLGGAAATAVSLYLGISHRDLFAELHDVRSEPLVLAALGSMILLGLQSLRWWIVMRPVLPLTYPQAFKAMVVGFCGNVLLPARGGDLLRVQYLGRRTGVSRAKLLGTEIVDFWSDKWGWIAAFPVICLLGDPPAWLAHAHAGVRDAHRLQHRHRRAVAGERRIVRGWRNARAGRLRRRQGIGARLHLPLPPDPGRSGLPRRHPHPRRRWGIALRQAAGRAARNAPPGNSSGGSGMRRSVQERETRVVGGADRPRLIAVAHDPDADEIGHVSLEVGAELG